MELILLIACALLLLIILFILLTKGKNREESDRIETSLKEQNGRLESIIRELNLRVETVIREQSYENRDELGKTIREFRTELTTTLNTSMQQMQDSLHKNMITGNELQREKFEAMGKTQEALIQSTEKRLDDMRVMVEEKLQKTLNERIGQSFEIVRTQLENVQKGLGEMKSLAQDVGGLKKVLTNVKMRGTFGEVQLGALLEQMMSPEQYDANVKTKKSATEFVEYAIKLPGKDDAYNTVYMPIDAKFPKDVYEQYYDAFEAGDAALIDSSSKQLEITIKRMAKDIHDKYIDPPFTTDFAIMFLPFESIYAEVIRRTALVETLQKDYKIVVTGPTTLGAILNSLQMGFRTLAIQKRTSEVWTVLGAVKTEFGKFGGLLEKVQKNIQNAGDQLEEVMGKRTRAIERRLKQVEALPTEESQKILPLADMDDEE
ncbi:DNA recombination protein RmuC [uncultured Bacteroides sp.]|uniref:DNA recombination protein RmuC n=1 Tax=uncultured Bacteroides sp. TaxID=162156 RepID=UPI002AABBE21|nr:DNA recombination protein RmuC [uncultured Bacteroides sp.]